MNTPPTPVNPGQPNIISLSAQNTPVVQQIPASTPAQQQQPSTSHWPVAERIAIVSAGGAGTSAIVSGISVATEAKESDRTAERAMNAGLREVYHNCRNKDDQEYTNKDALYNLNTYSASEKERIECLKNANRLDEETHYIVEKDEAVPYAKTDKQHKVTVFENQEPVALTKMNDSQDQFNCIEQQADDVTSNLPADQAVSMKGVTSELKKNIVAARGVIEESAITIANPRTSSAVSSVAENKASDAVKTVEFSVSQRDKQLNHLKTEKQSSQTTTVEFVNPSPKAVPGTPPFASIMNPFVHKKQKQFCSVGQDPPVVTNSSNRSPDYRLTIFLFALSGCFTCFYFFCRKKRIQSERQQSLYAVETEKQREKSEYQYTKIGAALTIAKELNDAKITYNQAEFILLTQLNFTPEKSRAFLLGKDKK